MIQGIDTNKINAAENIHGSSEKCLEKLVDRLFVSKIMLSIVLDHHRILT